MTTGETSPIFILGITPRSGTNYLWDLLRLHPSCGAARHPVREDLFLEHAEHLTRFAAEVRSSWDPKWGVFEDGIENELLAALGDGLLGFLTVDPQRRLLTKSPSVRNLDRFFELFPRARLLILVRDGRSVVQSCMATFGWEFERAAREWASAGSQILRFIDAATDDATFRLVRYEDLLDDLEGTMRGILAYLDLDPAAWDLEAARRLPVRGSSVDFGPGHDKIHWDPVERTADFDPRRRWGSWSPGMLERFAWIGGVPMRRFGYELELELDPLRRVPQAFGHRMRDIAWWGTSWARRLEFIARVKLGTATRPLRERFGLVRTER
jgi:hypothetical protein